MLEITLLLGMHDMLEIKTGTRYAWNVGDNVYRVELTIHLISDKDKLENSKYVYVNRGYSYEYYLIRWHEIAKA